MGEKRVRMDDLDGATAIMGIVLVVVLIAGFVTLSVLGVDTDAFVLFAAGPLVSGAVGAILTRKIADVRTVVDKVEHATNAVLTAQFVGVDAHMDRQDEDVANVAGSIAAQDAARLQRPDNGQLAGDNVVG